MFFAINVEWLACLMLFGVVLLSNGELALIMITDCVSYCLVLHIGIVLACWCCLLIVALVAQCIPTTFTGLSIATSFFDPLHHK